MRCRDTQVKDDKLDMYFFTGGWDPTDEGDFIVRL